MSADAPPVVRIASADDAATEAVGAALARALPAGLDRSVRLHLQGDLGAGKTTLVRGFLRALGVTGTVRSPTYGLLEPYALADRMVLHLDLYRLVDESEMAALGLRDHDTPGAVWLIEWPERGGTALPEPDLRVTMIADRTAHHLQIEPRSTVGRRWLAAASLAGA